VDYVTSWALAFLLTQIIEIPIYLRAQRSTAPRALFVAFGASAITHPFVWFVFPDLLEDLDQWQMIAVAEVFALTVEALWLRLFKVKRPLGWSLAANGASFGVGLLLTWLTGWP
jgi:hypothetical protein